MPREIVEPNNPQSSWEAYCAILKRCSTGDIEQNLLTVRAWKPGQQPKTLGYNPAQRM